MYSSEVINNKRLIEMIFDTNKNKYKTKPFLQLANFEKLCE